MANVGSLIYKVGIEFIRERLPKDATTIYPSRKFQDQILNKLKSENPEPLSLIQSAFLQHTSQLAIYTKQQYYLLQAASAVSLLPFLVFAWLFPSKKNISKKSKLPIAILFFHNRKLVPRSLFDEFEIIDSERGISLTLKDLSFIFRIWIQHPLWFYFIMKIAYRTAAYRHSIHNGVKAFIVSNEYASASSAMTSWCESEGIEHINIQHGASIFNVRDSFSTHHRFYVWNEHFLKLFKSIYLRPYRFIVEAPPELYLKLKQVKKNDPPVVKYFLQINSDEDLLHIANTMRPLKSIFNVVIRPHPRFSKSIRLRNIFSEFEIEDPSITIDDSILNSDYVVSRYSTVLLQAILANKNAVVDDVTDPVFFNRLKELDFCVFRESHLLLSEVLQSKT